MTMFRANALSRASGLAIALLVVAAGCGGSQPTAQSTPLTPVTISVSVGVYQLPLFAALVSGEFLRQGLDVKLVVGGTGATPMVVSGQADLASVGVPGALLTAAAGKPTSVIWVNATDFGVSSYFVGAANITSPQQCKRVVTAAQASSTYAWAVVYKKVLHLSYDIVPLTDFNQIPVLIQSGQADCGVGGFEPLASALQANKVHLLVDPKDKASFPQEVPLTSVGVSLWGLKDHLTAQRSTFVRVLRALKRSEAHVKTLSDAQLADELRRNSDWQLITRDTVLYYLANERGFTYPNHGLISKESWASTINFLNIAFPQFTLDSPLSSYDARIDMSYFNAAGT